MKRFKNILVGVDLSSADRAVSSELAATTVVAIDRALKLAKRNSARVTLSFALDVSERARFVLEHIDEEEKHPLLDQIHGILREVEKPFTEAGIEVDHHVSIGPPWLEITRRVLKNEHDLVIIGARNHGPVERFFLGTTGVRLLRKCPCPVWVVKHHDEDQINSTMVANDLSPLSNTAMELGCSLAEMFDAKLHVLHVMEQPLEDAALATVVSTETEDDNLRDIAEQEIGAQLDQIDPQQQAEVHIVPGVADGEIGAHLEKLNIDLLVMGTISRTGIPGVLIGNTAERLLPYIGCSILAIKPDDFVCPITA